VKLNDPQLVRDEYASEVGLQARRSIYTNRDGPDACDEALRIIAAQSTGILRGERVEVPEFQEPLRATRRVSIFVASP
jgi:hypothetical protein